MTASRPLRLRAPELRGRGWLNTGGQDIRLADLRGRVVVLDFWTFCCVNCLHVLDELRSLEKQFGDRLVLIGVHSPKFTREADPVALADAVERYAVHHPVLDDPELVTWGAYTARARPTLVVIDPQGYIVASMSGEGHGHGLALLVEELLAEHEHKGTLADGPGPYVPAVAQDTQLRFPGKVAALPDGSLLVSDTTHHQVVHLEADLVTERRRWGGPGLLNEPQGIALLPPEAAALAGADAVVADSVNHRIVGIRFDDDDIRTLAGTGEQLRERGGAGDATTQPLSTPWDLVWWQGRLVLAMAGTHQLWELLLDPEPAHHQVRVLAGTSAEGIRDGAGEQAWFAQPSGLAVSPDGSTLWVADAETSALRSVTVAGSDGAGPVDGAESDELRVEVRTHIGQGLFDFGHQDGPAAQALLQHPLGVSALPDGSVAISDTYNGAVRRYDPESGVVETIVGGLREPSDAVLVGSGEDAHLIVVESAGHALVRAALPQQATHVDGPANRTHRPPTELSPGPVELLIDFVPPTGQKLDDRYGDPTQLVISSSPEAFLREGAGTAQGLTRRLVLDPAVGSGILHISVRAAACDGDPTTGAVPEHAACHLYQQDWGVPVVLAPDADDQLRLDLRGVR